MLEKIDILLSEKKQKAIYSHLYSKYHEDCRALHWSSRQSQVKRFWVFSAIISRQEASILDVGCGLGDFASYLHNNHEVKFSYTGIDVVEEFILAAARRYPSSTFVHKSILAWNAPQQFDYVFASGIFAFGTRAFFVKTLEKCFSLARKAFAFNLFVSENRNFFYDEKENILKSCLALSPGKVTLRDDYLPRDYTVILEK